MKYIINLLIILIMFSILVFTACDDTLTGDDIDNRIIPDENVSFSEHLQPVFNIKCSIAGCHDDISKAGGYSMTTWSNVLQPGIVDPFTPETSRIIWRIEGIGVDFMPPLESPVRPLTDNQIDGVKTWIKEGAENN
ncbi:hypothetical protein ACFLS9_07620 [Bacteroidota bacterium]